MAALQVHRRLFWLFLYPVQNKIYWKKCYKESSVLVH